MAIKEIILDYLKKNNYDGLCNPDVECGCGIDDFMPCDNIDINCQPAYKKLCKNCGDFNSENGCFYDCSRGDGCYSVNK